MLIITRKTFIEEGREKSVDVQQFVHSLAVLNEVWITFTLKTPKVTPKAPPQKSHLPNQTVTRNVKFSHRCKRGNQKRV